ncbi:helix-turn-helix domain-containing protein [Aquimarina spongiae]|nr:helix-turn-helix domain-containing protein [Aquimarina spongiae]
MLFNIHSVVAFQSSFDSLLTKKYSYLKKRFFENTKDSVHGVLYAQSYLIKAKEDNDTIKIVNGFYYMSGIIRDTKMTEKYIDSMIMYSKNLKTKYYPALAYYNKGKIAYNKGHFKTALDFYLKTNQKAKEFENIHLFYASKKSIGILKSRIGEHQTALQELKECYLHYSKQKEEKSKTYLSTLSALSATYSLNKKLDSATILNQLGHKESIEFNGKNFTYYFTLNEGINLFYKKNFITAKDSLSNVIEVLKTNGDRANLSIAYFFYGKTLSELGQEEEAIHSHIKVDEIFQEITEIMPDNRENYEILINYYKKRNDKDNQLKYIERLISVDSVLHTNYRYLIKTVVQNYDTPRLLSEKQKIIYSLETEKKTSHLVILILVIICFLFFVLWSINRRKQKQYKQRFEELYQNQDYYKTQDALRVSQKEKTKLAIPEESIKDILTKLANFENEIGFTRSDLSVNSLAKNFGTNSKYLSKIINTYKQKTFNHYINGLRIKQSIIQLKADSKFRKYTIKAIAQEMGFNTTDAFSKAFYKQNGIHPSYFIKELEKQVKNNGN